MTLETTVSIPVPKATQALADNSCNSRRTAQLQRSLLCLKRHGVLSQGLCETGKNHLYKNHRVLPFFIQTVSC